MYLSQLDGTDSWFTKHIVSTKPAELTGTGQYVYKAAANESLAIVRARISNNRIVVCSTESLSMGISANLRQGQFNTQLALNSAINSYGMGSGFAIQEAVRNTPPRVEKKKSWILEDGSLVDSIVFDKPSDVNSNTARALFTGITLPSNLGKTILRFEDEQMNGEGTSIQMLYRIIGDDYTSLQLRFKSAAVTSSFVNYPTTTRILVRFYDKDDESKMIFEDYTAPLTFNAAAE